MGKFIQKAAIKRTETYRNKENAQHKQLHVVKPTWLSGCCVNCIEIVRHY